MTRKELLIQEAARYIDRSQPQNLDEDTDIIVEAFGFRPDDAELTYRIAKATQDITLDHKNKLRLRARHEKDPKKKKALAAHASAVGRYHTTLIDNTTKMYEKYLKKKNK